MSDRTWTDADRLTYEQLEAGVSCRNCKRPFFGGPEWVAVMHRTPEQAAAIEAEEAEFLKLHPECESMRWTVAGGGIHHCARCCAPPPFADETYRRLAQILLGARRRLASEGRLLGDESNSSAPRSGDDEVPSNRRFLGQVVHVRVDRRLGSTHPEHGFTYPVNYGSVPGESAPDGDELDAYILGVFEPVEEFTGRCIAIVHRTNDDDDKLVVVPEGRKFSAAQIRALTEFQEQWFDSEIWRPSARVVSRSNQE